MRTSTVHPQIMVYWNKELFVDIYILKNVIS